jgi:hypothetical protein
MTTAIGTAAQEFSDAANAAQLGSVEVARLLRDLKGRRVNLPGYGHGSVRLYYAFQDGSVAALSARRMRPVEVPAFLKCAGMAGECTLAACHGGRCVS